MTSAFEGEKVRLRALERSDVEEVMKWINDTEVTQYVMTGMFPVSREAEERWIERSLDEKCPEKVFVIVDKKTDGYVGGCSLFRIDTRLLNAELGIIIGKKEYWGKGYGADAIRVLLRLAFNRMNLHRVYLRVFGYNKRGIRCYEKIGFKHEGVEREQHYFEGKYHDVIRMAILRPEFAMPEWQAPQ